MKVKSISIAEEKHTHPQPRTHTTGGSLSESGYVYTPVQDVIFEMEDGRKFLSKMTFVSIDEEEKHTT